MIILTANSYGVKVGDSVTFTATTDLPEGTVLSLYVNNGLLGKDSLVTTGRVSQTKVLFTVPVNVPINTTFYVCRSLLGVCIESSVSITISVLGAISDNELNIHDISNVTSGILTNPVQTEERECPDGFNMRYDWTLLRNTCQPDYAHSSIVEPVVTTKTDSTGTTSLDKEKVVVPGFFEKYGLYIGAGILILILLILIIRR